MSNNLLSMQNFVNWLRTQPPTETYCYSNGNICVIAQYLEAMGARVLGVDVEGWTDAEGYFHAFPGVASPDTGDNPFNRVANPGRREQLDAHPCPPYTFGAALHQAEIELACERASR